jgi:hypothetical protein
MLDGGKGAVTAGEPHVSRIAADHGSASAARVCRRSISSGEVTARGIVERFQKLLLTVTCDSPEIDARAVDPRRFNGA